MDAGEENGMRGYFLTFMIAYIRDFVMSKYFIAESMETSCPWSKVSSSISKCREKILELCRKRNVNEKYVFSSFRVTQLYETGAAIYIYIGFNFYPNGVKEAVDIFEEVEAGAREVLMQNGASISHHHGVGKKRKKFLSKTYPKLMIDLMKEVKKTLDPKNIFAINNTYYASKEEEIEDNKEHHVASLK